MWIESLDKNEFYKCNVDGLGKNYILSKYNLMCENNLGSFVVKETDRELQYFKTHIEQENYFNDRKMELQSL